MRPPSRHSSAAFFSSLRQVEKRLESEHTSLRSNLIYSNPSQNLSSSATSAADDSSSVIHLNLQPVMGNTCTYGDTAPPQEFLSHPLDFGSGAENSSGPYPSKRGPVALAEDDGDDIERLMSLLGMMDGTEERGGDLNDASLFGDAEFLSRVAGVKGVKSRKEMERLEGWIAHFSNGNSERTEPLRLAHLLLAKASWVYGDQLGIVFPDTVEEFLEKNPPTWD